MLVILACKAKTPVISFTPDFTKGPPAIVYQANKKYKDHVPVFLSEDKSRIVGYPGIHDIRVGNSFPYPIALHKGYFLDNKGITERVAFLKLTYDEYARLDSLPGKNEMYNWIIDKDPITSLCNCGNRHAFTDIERQLNELIDAKQLETVCKKMK